MDRLTEAQRKVLAVIGDAEPISGWKLFGHQMRTKKATVKALERRGLVRGKFPNGEAAGFSFAKIWTITPAGRSALSGEG